MRDGREVVVKVQRPGIRERIATDMEALNELAQFADKHLKAGSRYGQRALRRSPRARQRWPSARCAGRPPPA